MSDAPVAACTRSASSFESTADDASRPTGPFHKAMGKTLKSRPATGWADRESRSGTRLCLDQQRPSVVEVEPGQGLAR
ncbi:hypothetical protein EJB05_33423 [Eragrostis curvula]|uniref:Uncharacterized protein n=1 Tax=Eragrostis curvula TaxID=38414 RepID=A0A5J9U2L0_9POAL|nr:hypothetical protein EJB05_33423 [Eragrostis curvula]